MERLEQLADKILEEVRTQRELLEDISDRVRSLETRLDLLSQSRQEDGKVLGILMERCRERGELLEKLMRSKSTTPPPTPVKEMRG